MSISKMSFLSFFEFRSGLGYGPELQCCKGVVDPITLLSLLAGIVGVAYILYAAILKKIVKGKKRRSVGFENWQTNILKGNGFLL